MKFKQKYLRWKAKTKLINQYEYLIEVDKILEEDATHKILTGGSTQFIENGRKNLLEIQQRLRVNKEFVDFLKTL